MALGLDTSASGILLYALRGQLFLLALIIMTLLAGTSAHARTHARTLARTHILTIGAFFRA